MEEFRPIKPAEYTGNPFTALNDQWMLISAEKDGRVNGMTASWGGMGVIWNMPVAFAFVRITRFTKEFMDSADTFSLTFFEHEKHRAMLNYMGSVSGRDQDKIKNTGLTVLHHGITPYYSQAETVFICKKLYQEYMPPENFTLQGMDERFYPKKDYHYMYIGEITDILTRRG